MEDVTDKLLSDKDRYEDDAEYILGYCQTELEYNMV